MLSEKGAMMPNTPPDQDRGGGQVPTQIRHRDQQTTGNGAQQDGNKGPHLHQAIAAHQSQNPTYWSELARRHNAFYGARCNRDYAEGFRRLPLAMMSNLPAHDYLF